MDETMDSVLVRPDTAAVQAHGAAGRQRKALMHLLAGLRAALDTVSTARRAAVRRRRGLLQRKFLLGLELHCKLEEQVLLPALAHALDEPDAGPAAEPRQALQMAQREIELLRDLSMLVTRTASANRETVVGVLEGLVDVHVQRVDALVVRVPVADVPWRALETDMRGLLGRWRDEVLAEGDIEDEDRDPVGLPPR